MHGKSVQTDQSLTMVNYAIYAAGSFHLADFARRIGVAVFKIGVSRFGPQNRIAALSRHRYAGLWGRPGQLASAMTSLEHADNWFQIKLDQPPSFAETAFPDLRFCARAISFDLPGSIHPEIVDQSLHNLLANRSLATFLRSDTGQIRLRNADIDQNSWFHTHYRNVDAPDQLVPARELYIFDPNEDVPLLATGLSRLVTHLAKEQTYGCP
jgi:hypothetical protein